ncbi:YncE family protein [Paracoccus aestuariivivens]|uniref:YncE family protein n=1 Tax=Paracoccus aestuariivivens TaxID=1820333 RepID=A0A6L6JB04_9RHOB|nr:YncE family protein [Paracoccus aestuariivivens]MTH78308.1 YncE family protein [Paracoccus aestuariivivens]
MIRAVSALAVGLWAGSAGAADLAFVTSQNADAVSVINLQSGKILAETPVGGAPAPVAYDPDHQRAYVISAKTGRLTVLDESGAVTLTKDFPEGAFGLAATKDGGVFVTDWYQARLFRLDASLQQLWTVPTGKAPAGVATDGRLVATADRDEDQISVYDTETGDLWVRVKVGKHPYAITFHKGLIWTADVRSDTVSVVDPVQGRMIGQVPTGSHPYGIAFAKGRGFVTNQYAGTVTVFDPDTRAQLATLETGDYPEGIAALPDGSGVVVAHWDSNNLVWIDAATLSVTHELDLPDGPRAFGEFTGRQH